MRFVWLSARKDLLRRMRDPLALVGWVGIPLIMTALLHFVFGGGGAAPRGLLLVADEDDSVGSRLLTGAFSQGRLAEMITVETVRREDGHGRIQKGKGAALLVIPKGFGGAVVRNEPVRLELLTNPSQRIMPGIIEEALSMMVDGVFYLQLVAGDQIRAIAQGPPAGAQSWPDLGVAAISVAINRLVGRLRQFLDPPLIHVDNAVVEQREPFRMAESFFPGMLFLGFLFMAQGLSADIWREQAQGALRRAAASPPPIQAFLAGKTVGAALMVAAVGVFGLTAAHWLLAVRIAHPVAALLWVSFAGTALFLLMSLIQMHSSNMRTGNIMCSVVLFPLAMVGGSFFPFEVMPKGLAAIGRHTPNGWAIVQFRAILSGGVEPGALAVAFSGLFVVGGAAFWLASRRVRRFI